MARVLHASELYGGGYNRFRRSRHRYRVLKGSRASKKSKNTAQDYVEKLMRHPEANLLCVRKTFRTIKDSQWTDLKWAANRMGAAANWAFTTSPLEATYLPTGQKILFRGMDDPLKVTSITVEHGYLCWAWIEEAYEIMSEADFDTLDESIRGRVPDDLWKQVTLTFNPWNDRHWLKSRFFDRPDPDVLALTTDYRCNEWLDASDLAMFERMREGNPRRYRVAGLGDWGVVEGLVYENWKEERFDVGEVLEAHPNAVSAFGLDFGYTNDPSALFCGLYDRSSGVLWVFDEMYKKGMSNAAIAAEVRRMGYGKERIVADSAEPKSIDQLKGLGIRAKGAKKGRDSVNAGIQFIQDLRIVVHPRCVNFITEIGNYMWDTDRFGKRLNVPVGDYNHLMDAMRYGMEPHIKRGGWLT